MRKFYIVAGELHELTSEADAEHAGALPYVASDWNTFMVFYGSHTADDTDYDALIARAAAMCQERVS